MERNIFFSPVRVYKDQSLGMSYNSVLWMRSLKPCILYWDNVYTQKLLETGNNATGDPNPELDFLSHNDALGITTFSSGKDILKSLPDWRQEIHNFLIEQNKKDRLGIMFHSDGGEDQVELIQNFFGTDPELNNKLLNVEVILKNCFPVPQPNVSYEDILKFKSKRNAELLSFHSKIEELSHIFVKNSDFETSVKLAKSQLEPVLNDIHKTMTENLRNVALTSLKVNLGNFSKNAIIGASTGLIVGEPIAGAMVGSAIGGLIGMVKDAIDTPQFEGPFAYTFYATTDLRLDFN